MNKRWNPYQATQTARELPVAKDQPGAVVEPVQNPEEHDGAQHVVEGRMVVDAAVFAHLRHRAFQAVVLRRHVISRPDPVAEEEVGGPAQVLDYGKVADPADDRADRKAERSHVEGGPDPEAQSVGPEHP